MIINDEGGTGASLVMLPVLAADRRDGDNDRGWYVFVTVDDGGAGDVYEGYLSHCDTDDESLTLEYDQQWHEDTPGAAGGWTGSLTIDLDDIIEVRIP